MLSVVSLAVEWGMYVQEFQGLRLIYSFDAERGDY